MSMLSAQVDELRELADGIEERYGYPTAVTALREAADTIWQLRDDLQRTNAENTKLRELVQYICDENYGDDWFAEKAAELGIEARY